MNGYYHVDSRGGEIYQIPWVFEACYDNLNDRLYITFDPDVLSENVLAIRCCDELISKEIFNRSIKLIKADDKDAKKVCEFCARGQISRARKIAEKMFNSALFDVEMFYSDNSDDEESES